MNALSHANGRHQPLPNAAIEQPDALAGPRFTVEAAALPSNQQPQSPNSDPSAAGPTGTEPSIAPPKTKKRFRNSVRDRQERVSDMKKLLPRKVPRLRDLKIYEYIAFEKMSQHQVAEIFGLSQVRILQIVREVRAWKSTVPYDIPGMTDEQQVNLATHETRQWLARIRDKCLEQADMTSCGETKTYIDPQTGVTQRVMNERTVAPKPGFMAVALAAVLQSGKLAGAGEQWKRSGENEECSGRITKHESQMRKECRSANGQASSSQSTGRLLKEKTAETSPQNGKLARQKSSGFPRQAQVERLRREKIRQIAYQKEAERQGVSAEYQPHFFRLLRELDRIADRVEEKAQQERRRDKVPRTPEERRSRLLSDRNYYLDFFLRMHATILTAPYDFQWVTERYRPETGCFRWIAEEEQGTADREVS